MKNKRNSMVERVHAIIQMLPARKHEKAAVLSGAYVGQSAGDGTDIGGICLQNTWRTAFMAFVCTILLMCLPVFLLHVSAEEAFDSLSFEVKFQLDPDKVLTGDKLLTTELKEQFDIGQDLRIIDLIFLDL